MTVAFWPHPGRPGLYEPGGSTYDPRHVNGQRPGGTGAARKITLGGRCRP